MISGVLLFNIGYFLTIANQSLSIDYFIGIAIIIIAFAFATIQNDIEDIAIDRINSPDKVLVNGELSTQDALNFNTALLTGLLVLSLYSFPKFILSTLIMLAFIWAYNKAPLYLSRKPVSSISIMALMYSTIPICLGYFINNGSNHNGYLFGFLLCWFIVRFSISVLKDFKDAEGDRVNNKKTFYLSYGYKVTIWTSLISSLLGYSGVIMLLFIKQRSLLSLGLMAAISVWLLYRRSNLFKTNDNKKLTDVFHKIFFEQNQFDLLFLLCLIFLK